MKMHCAQFALTFSFRDQSLHLKQTGVEMDAMIFHLLHLLHQPARSGDAARLPRSCTLAPHARPRGCGRSPNKFLRCARCRSGVIKILTAARALAIALG